MFEMLGSVANNLLPIIAGAIIWFRRDKFDNPHMKWIGLGLAGIGGLMILSTITRTL